MSSDPRSIGTKQDYEDFFKFSLDILCINGLDGYFRLVNPAFERILGYSAEEIMSKHFLEFLHPDDLAATRVQFAHRVAGRHTTHFQNRYRRKDGSYVWIEWTSYPVIEKGVMFAVGHDVTERKQAEEVRLLFEREKAARQEAEAAVELRNNFIAMASHELRTPLTALAGYIQLVQHMLRESSPGSSLDAGHKLAELADQQIQRLTKLTQDMIDATRMSDGNFILARQRIDLGQLVSRILERLRKDFEKAGCEVEGRLEDGLAGEWDLLRIEQVVVNLLTNAMKFGRGRAVAVRIWREGGQAKLEVRDHGIGIKPENQQTIFECFSRSESIKSYEGLGLGLYLCRQIALAHHGSLSVASEVGQGASFILSLPLGPSAA